MDEIDHQLKAFIDLTEADLRRYQRIGEVDGKSDIPRQDGSFPSSAEDTIVNEADSMWSKFRDSHIEALAKNEQSVEKLQREIEQDISVALDKISDEKLGELDLLEAEYGTSTAEYRNLKQNLERTETEVSEIRTLLNRPLNISFVKGYLIFMVCLAFAEVPVNRLAFELFFEQSPLLSLLLSGAVGILFVLFAHIIGTQVRHAQCRELHPAKGSVYLSVGALILMSLLVMYFLGVMREQLVAVQNSANLNLEDMLSDDVQNVTSSGLTSLAIGPKGFMLLLLNLSIYVSGIVMAFMRHDPHPRYEAASKELAIAKSAFLRYQKNFETKQVERLRDFNQKHSYNKGLQRQREAAIEGINRTRDSLHSLYESSRTRMVNATWMRINTYRQANIKSRKTAQPEYFKNSAVILLEERLK